MSPPLVSVIIPCHLAENDIRTAMQSLARQTHTRIEAVVVSDDGADYRKALSALPALPECVFATTGGIGTGPSNAKNIGLSQCRGDAVLILDADDFLDPGYIEAILPRTMAEGACVTPRRPVSYDTHTRLHPQGEHAIASYATERRISIRDYIFIPFGWQTAYRRDMLTDAWEEELFLDQDLVLETLLFERIGYAPYENAQGYNYRVRAGSICHSDTSHERVFSEYALMLSRLRDPANGMGLGDESRALLEELLVWRMENVRRYLADQASATLKYEPQVIMDMLHYPA